MTTKEPDDSMIEVAIRAVEAVFDWRAYENETFGTQYGEDAEREEACGTTGKSGCSRSKRG